MFLCKKDRICQYLRTSETIHVWWQSRGLVPLPVAILFQVTACNHEAFWACILLTNSTEMLMISTKVVVHGVNDIVRLLSIFSKKKLRGEDIGRGEVGGAGEGYSREYSPMMTESSA